MALSTADQLTIWNQALSLLGERPIAALDSAGPASRILELHWETVRDSLLRGHRWNFARKRASLTASETAPAFGWGYSYPLPSDCLRVLELNGIQAAMTDADFELEGANLLTNADEAKIVYVYRVTDPTLYDSLFTEALAIKLAIACCLEITQSNSKKAELLKELEGLSLPEAVVVDAQESRSPIIPPGSGSATLAARGGAYSYSGGSSYYPASSGNGSGTPGANGSDGWSPGFAVVEDGERRVVQITGWTGGEGDEPETGYISSSGVVSTPGNATDIRGAAGAGSSGNVTGSGATTDNAILRANGANGTSIQSSGITIADGATGTLSGTNTGDQDLSGLVVKANNLSDLANATTARTNLGLGNVSTLSLNGNGSMVLAGNGTFIEMTGGNGSGNGTVTSVAVSGGTTGLTTSGGPITSSGTITLAGTLAVANGGTGATTDSGARTALGLGNISVLNLNGDGATTLLGNGTFAAVGTGGVTSVDASTTVSGLSFSGGPVTSSGTLSLSGTISAVTQAAVTAHQAALAVGVSQVTGLGTGVATFLATPSSSNLAAAVTGETGSGALVFGTSPTIASPTLTTPILGTPTSGTLTNCTGLPVAGIVASTSTALGVGSVELGHASDTTISRVSAGVVAIEGVTVVTVSASQTLTNKTLTSPTFTTPVLGTPSSGNLTNCTALPASSVVGLATIATSGSASDLGSGTLPAARIGSDTIDAITEVAASIRSGAGSKLITGAAGASDNFAAWDSNGDAVDSGYSASSFALDGHDHSGVYQPADTQLTDLAALPYASNALKVIRVNAGETGFELVTISAGGGDLLASNNLSDVLSATTAATNLGLGTGSSPQFTGINLGHATDTTITRVSAGVIAVEGVNVLLSGGALGTPSSGTLTNVTGLPVSTGISGLGTGIATFLATPSSANLRSALTDETGTGAAVFADSPTLVTPALGTPSSGNLTNAIGLPVSTGISGLAAGVATFLATPSSANLRSALTDESGTGSAYFQGGDLGTPSAGVLTSCTIKEQIGVACSDETTALTTGTAKVTFRMPFAMTLTAVRASVTTAPTGSTLIVDINEAGSTILSTKLSIDASEKTSTTAATAAVISDTALADDAEITIDIDQVGSTVAGAGLKVWLIGTRS